MLYKRIQYHDDNVSFRKYNEYFVPIVHYYSFVQILIKAQGQTLFAGLDDTLKS